MVRKLGRLFGVVGLVLLLLVMSTSPVLAIADPDSIEIQSVKVFQNIFETGDMLFFVRSDVDYATDPTSPASRTFLVALYDIGGIIFLYQRALNNYDLNIISIYLDATQAEDLTWNGPYVIRVMGNPSVFGTLTEDVNMDTITLEEAANYIDGSTSVSRSSLGAFSVNTAELLQDSEDWPVLVTDDGLLNSTGGVALNTAIPGLFSVCSSFFATAVSPPVEVPPVSRTVFLYGVIAGSPFTAGEVVTGATTGATGTFIAGSEDTAEIRVTHTASIMFRNETVEGVTSGATITVTEVVVGDIEAASRDRTGARLRAALDGVGDWLGMSGNMVAGMGLFLVFAMTAGFVFTATGSVHGGILCAIPVILLGNFMGLLSFAFTWMLVIVVALIFAILFIMGRLA